MPRRTGRSPADPNDNLLGLVVADVTDEEEPLIDEVHDPTADVRDLTGDGRFAIHKVRERNVGEIYPLMRTATPFMKTTSSLIDKTCPFVKTTSSLIDKTCQFMKTTSSTLVKFSYQ
jgi:hypothetical protein